MALVIDKLNKSFDKKVIFKDFSYTFESAGLYVLIGDSGVGKTTLLRIISGLDKRFLGVVSPDKRSVSFAFQEYRLFPTLSALENVLEASFDSYNDEDAEAVKSMLARLGFSEDEMNLYPSELSGGMKQRVALARAFMKRSDILLLDEPTKELDEGLREVVVNIISEEAKKRLVILVSHELSELEKTNPIIIKIEKQF